MSKPVEELKLCLCGRRADQLHCPHCGWADVRALVSKQRYAIQADGSERVINVYRCRKCGDYFDQIELETNCRALPPRRGRKPDALRDKRPDEVLTPEALDTLQTTSVNYNPNASEEERLAELRKLIGGKL